MRDASDIRRGILPPADVPAGKLANAGFLHIGNFINLMEPSRVDSHARGVRGRGLAAPSFPIGDTADKWSFAVKVPAVQFKEIAWRRANSP